MKDIEPLSKAIRIVDTATEYIISFEKPVITLEKTLGNEIRLYLENMSGYFK